MIRLPLAHAQDLLMLAFPLGGQRTARRNAWAGMSDDAARSRARRAAEAALESARARAASGTRTGS